MKKQLALLLVQSLDNEGIHIKLNAHFESSKLVNGHPPGFGLVKVEILPPMFGVAGDRTQMLEVVEAYCSPEQAKEASVFLKSFEATREVTFANHSVKRGNLHTFYILTDLG